MGQSHMSMEDAPADPELYPLQLGPREPSGRECSIEALMTKCADLIQRLENNISRALVGKSGSVRLAVVGLLARGHLLIEDVPGVGKTTLAAALARSIGAGFQRIQFTSDMLPSDVLRSTRILHLSGISQAISATACDACFAAIDIARGAGARISYDPNLRLKLWPLSRARAVIRATLGIVDWVLPSQDDARVLFGSEDADALVDACHAAGAPLVVLKRGPDGCIVSDGKRRETIGGHVVNCIDATGAGDCFDGAFSARICAGDDPFTAARYANAAAALATTGYSAVAPLPDDAAVRVQLRRAA